MDVVAKAGSYSTATSVSLGIAVGVGAVVLSLTASFLLGQWSVDDSVTRLSSAPLLPLLWFVTQTVAVFAIPVALYLRHLLLTPVVVLAAVVSFWIATGLYALFLGPVWILLSLGLAGGEFALRRRAPRPESR